MEKVQLSQEQIDSIVDLALGEDTSQQEVLGCSYRWEGKLDLCSLEPPIDSADQLTVEMQPCNPMVVLEEVMGLMRPRAEEKLLRLDATFAGRVPEQIHSDPVRLRQILINLVSNAIKFTDKGSVTVEMQVKQRCGRRHAELIFAVQDTGMGISADKQRLLFQPFAQVHKHTPLRQPGTGLGLAISKRLAGMLGGDIHVSSAPGKGSTFNLNLPLDARDKASLVEAPRKLSDVRPQYRAGPARANLEGKRFLLVDDNPDNRNILRFLLEESSGEVFEAVDGEEGVRMVIHALDAGEPFDLILMDMQMPVKDGYEATRELRMRGVATPIVALTAYAMSEDRKRCIEAGCDDYVSKPIVPTTLFEALCRNIPGLRIQQPEPPSVPATGFSSPSSGPGLKITGGDRAYFRTVPSRQSADQSKSKPPAVPDEPALSLSEDPEFAELIELYLQNMIKAIDDLKKAHASGDAAELRLLTHRIKGSAGSYGYPRITQAAGDVERLLNSKSPIEEIAAPFRRLIELMEEATAGRGDQNNSSSV